MPPYPRLVRIHAQTLTSDSFFACSSRHEIHRIAIRPVSAHAALQCTSSRRGAPCSRMTRLALFQGGRGEGTSSSSFTALFSTDDSKIRPSMTRLDCGPRVLPMQKSSCVCEIIRWSIGNAETQRLWNAGSAAYGGSRLGYVMCSWSLGSVKSTAFARSWFRYCTYILLILPAVNEGFRPTQSAVTALAQPHTKIVTEVGHSGS